MEETYLQRMEQTIGNAMSAELENIREELRAARAEVGSLKEDLKNDFHLQVGILAEDFQHKLQIIAEGHQMLAEKMDRMQRELGEIGDTVTAVSTDLAAHRADTEELKKGNVTKES